MARAAHKGLNNDANVIGITAIKAKRSVAKAATTSETSVENPELLDAYRWFLATKVKVAEINEELEWLADEWRHRWPVAPDEILGWRADNDETENAERDIIGRRIMRNPNDIPKKKRHDDQSACFTVHRVEWLQRMIENHKEPRNTRTERARLRAKADQLRFLAEFTEQLRLSRKYHAEITRLRNESGVEEIHRRLARAKSDVAFAAAAVARADARTTVGLVMKAQVIKHDPVVAQLALMNNTLGGLAHFVDAVLAVVGPRTHEN
jgi:hypothetical protein